MEVWGEGMTRLVTYATLEISALTRPVVTRYTVLWNKAVGASE